MEYLLAERGQLPYCFLHTRKPVPILQYLLRTWLVVGNLIHARIGMEYIRTTGSATLMIDNKICGYFVKIGPHVFLAADIGLLSDAEENVLDKIGCQQPIVQSPGKICLQFIGIVGKERCNTVGQDISIPSTSVSATRNGC